MKISPVDPSEIASLIRTARADGVMFGPYTYLFAAFDGDRPVAMAAVLIRRGRASFKSDYVYPSHRRQGLHSELIRYRLAFCGSVKRIDAICLPPSLKNYLRAGFMAVRKFKNATLVTLYQ